MSTTKMARKILQVGLLGVGLTAGLQAQADSQTTWFGEVADGEWLAGIKLGSSRPGHSRIR